MGLDTFTPRFLRTWRWRRQCADAFIWLEQHNAHLRQATRSDGYSTSHGWEVVVRGVAYYGAVALSAVDAARRALSGPAPPPHMRAIARDIPFDVRCGDPHALLADVHWTDIVDVRFAAVVISRRSTESEMIPGSSIAYAELGNRLLHLATRLENRLEPRVSLPIGAITFDVGFDFKDGCTVIFRRNGVPLASCGLRGDCDALDVSTETSVTTHVQVARRNVATVFGGVVVWPERSR
jgi:hypothetical protein